MREIELIKTQIQIQDSSSSSLRANLCAIQAASTVGITTVCLPLDAI